MGAASIGGQGGGRGDKGGGGVKWVKGSGGSFGRNKRKIAAKEARANPSEKTGNQKGRAPWPCDSGGCTREGRKVAA
jgi:hypothetical protein